MKILVHSPYWNTQGGGERYALTAASCLQVDHDVFVSIPTLDKLAGYSKRLGVNLANVSLFQKPVSKWSAFGFDGVFWVSDGSIPTLPVPRRIIHFQVPFQNVNGRSWKNRLKLFGATVVCNSRFTKRYVDAEFGMSSRVVYPPVETSLITAGRKEKMVLTVGRFSTSSQHKRQDILIDAFQSIWKTGMKGWRMVVVGTVEDEASMEIVKELRRRARGYPIAIRTDLPHQSLLQLYRKAILYWHAAGFGTDLSVHPERAEHFGISTVEAMAAGAIPCSFAAGGQTEIITDGVNGLLWSDPADLMRESLLLATNAERRQRMAERAVSRAHDFSRERFCREIRKLFS